MRINQLTISEVPHMASQWDFNKNKDDITKTASTLREPRYWVCRKCSHEWVAQPITRRKSSGKCPNCELKIVVVKGVNDIFTLKPYLTDWYDFDANKGINIYSLSKNSKVRLQWQCKKCNYKWVATIVSRFNSTNKCPCCDRNRSIKEGVNDLLTLCPEIKDTYDFEANKDVDFSKLSIGSQKKVFWLCKKCDYKWRTSVKSRYKSDFKCPCCGRNNIIKKGINDILTVLPDLQKIYDHKKTIENTDVNIYCEGVSSKKEVFWKCLQCYRSWKGPIYGRVKKINDQFVAVGCTHYNQRGKIDPNLPKVFQTNKLTEFWDVKNNQINPSLVNINSSKKVFWKCKTCGHEWQESIKSRHLANDDCPNCSSTLPVVAGVNDILSICPAFSSVYIYAKNKDVDIKSLGINSYVKVWCSCYKCGKERKMQIKQHIRKDMEGKYHLTICSDCYRSKANNNSSKLDKVNTLKAQHPDIAEKWSPNNAKSADNVLVSINSRQKWICNDCRGEYSSNIKDMVGGKKKCPYCNNEAPLPGYNTLKALYPDIAKKWSPNNSKSADEVLPNSVVYKYWVCTDCNNDYKAKINIIVSGGAKCPYCNNLKPLSGFNTLQDLHPDIAKKWSPNNTKSAGQMLTTTLSPQKWICNTCNGEYKATISDMIEGKNECLYCKNIKPLPGYNTLEALHPAIAKKWSPNNVKSADEVIPNQTNYAKWICTDCNHEYPAIIKNMLSGKIDCPYCNDKKVMPGFNCFATKHNDLMKEWDFVNNYILASADHISDISEFKVWWICPNNENHRYLMSISTKVLYKKRSRESCLFCRGLRRKKRHFV